MPRPSSPNVRPDEPSAQRIAPSLQALLEAQLTAGEHVVWIGRPSPQRMLMLFGCSALLLGAPIFAVGAIARRWIFSQPRTSATSAAAMSRVAASWNVIILGVIGLLLLSRLWEWWKALHTLYAVTNQRALVLETFRGRTVTQSFSGEQLARAVIREGPDGWGDLVFEREVFGSGVKRVQRDVGFLRIPDVARVQRLLPVTPPH